MAENEARSYLVVPYARPLKEVFYRGEPGSGNAPSRFVEDESKPRGLTFEQALSDQRSRRVVAASMVYALRRGVGQEPFQVFDTKTGQALGLFNRNGEQSSQDQQRHT